jgi:DNA-binding response OmpR family regulator
MPRPPRLNALVVDDEPLNNELMRLWLSGISEPSFDSVPAHSLTAARSELEGARFDAVLLDRSLGDGDGVELLRTIRSNKETSDLPVIIISGRKADREIIAGLDRGADDYLTKPCTAEMFRARLLAVLRRNRAPEKAPLIAGPGFQLDPVDGRLLVDGRVEHLEPKEAEILKILLRRPGVIHTAAFLHDAVWGGAGHPRNTLETRLSTLRGKLGRRASCLETIRGCGYRLLP